MSSGPLIYSPASGAINGVEQTNSFDLKIRIASLFNQMGHRLGAIALLATVGTWACLYLSKDCTIALSVACGTAEVGLLLALVVRQMTRTHLAVLQEANGVAIFNLVLFILALYLMAFTRLDEIRSDAGQFFSPSSPPQPEQQW